MKNLAIETIIKIINNLFDALLEYGYKLYDAENPGYFISRVRYDKEDDQLKFDTEEE